MPVTSVKSYVPIFAHCHFYSQWFILGFKHYPTDHAILFNTEDIKKKVREILLMRSEKYGWEKQGNAVHYYLYHDADL